MNALTSLAVMLCFSVQLVLSTTSASDAAELNPPV